MSFNITPVASGYQEIHPYSAMNIDSVKINTSLIMMKEWQSHWKPDKRVKIYSQDNTVFCSTTMDSDVDSWSFRCILKWCWLKWKQKVTDMIWHKERKGWTTDSNGVEAGAAGRDGWVKVKVEVGCNLLRWVASGNLNSPIPWQQHPRCRGESQGGG